MNPRARSAWPIVLAIVIRVGIWLTVPTSRFASDEDSYFTAGTRLLTAGAHDLFWPPLTGWFIAATEWLLHTTNIRWIRLVWISLDIGCLLALRALARRIAPVVAKGDARRAERFMTFVTLAYALYLPAISFAQFTTSETLALLQLLLVILLLTKNMISWRDMLLAGLLTGTLVLTRPNLLPLIVFLPAAITLGRAPRSFDPSRSSGSPRASSRGEHRRGASIVEGRLLLRNGALFVASSAIVVGATVMWNWLRAGELTISTNSAYNLYIGNRDLYAEDLDLFDPVATAGQVEFRRQYWTGELTYPTHSPRELQREAVAWIRSHPTLFARRALGRLGRVFAPKTDVLELAGGERRFGIFAPLSITLLAIANLQWVVLLFGGIVGLAALWRLHPTLGRLFVFTVLGSLPLCLIAISKPRYAFVFEPLLLLGAAVFIMAPRETLGLMGRAQRWSVGLAYAFLIWAWTAWLIFAFSSRLALIAA